MLLIGLTGSIGMGKSTCAALFREAGIPVHDSDAAVHKLYVGEAVPLIEQAFAGTTEGGGVNRALLAARVVGDAMAMKRLEALIHPLVSADRQAFIQSHHAAGHRALVLDVPLLFETGGSAHCDVICVVSAPFDVQKQRVLARAGMTEAKFLAILAQQMPDIEKRRRAHYVIDSSRGIAAAKLQIAGILRCVAGMTGSAWLEHRAAK